MSPLCLRHPVTLVLEMRDYDSGTGKKDFFLTEALSKDASSAHWVVFPFAVNIFQTTTSCCAVLKCSSSTEFSQPPRQLLLSDEPQRFTLVSFYYFIHETLRNIVESALGLAILQLFLRKEREEHLIDFKYC